VVGPALKDLHKRRDIKWVKSFVKNSTKVIESGDKDAKALFEKFNKTQMPAFEASLKIRTLKQFMPTLKPESETPAPVAVTPPAAPADPKNATGN
jgi:cytochrome c oxidase cbb3-type subunit 3